MKRQFLAGSHIRNEIYIMNGEGELVWSHPAANPQDLWMLADGSVAYTWKHGVRRIRRDGTELFAFTVEPPNEVPSLQLLPNGRFLIGVVGACGLFETDGDGKIVSRMKLSTSVVHPHAQFRFCRKTSEGNFLVPFTAEGAVREFNPDGSLRFERTGLPSPVCALRLPDGDIVVSMEHSVRRYSPEMKREVWRFSGDDVPDVDFAVAAGLQILRNGNILFTNWGSSGRNGKKAVHILEVSPEKNVVWFCDSPRIGNVGQCQLLKEDFSVSEECVLR